MNQEPNQKESFLSWQGQVTGPHTLREIQNLLKLGKIHSLYKIQIEGEWNLLRDYLSDLEQKAREAARKQTERILAPPPHPAGSIQKAIVVPDDDLLTLPSGTGPFSQSAMDEENRREESPGMAITSFVLSLLFFIPFLNGLTWLLALIFGHLSLTQGYPESHCKSTKSTTLAWIGLWITYIEISFFLLGLAWFLIIEFPNMSIGYFILHAQMLVNVLGALVGAAVLMLAVKLVSGNLIPFPVCFVGALLPSAIGALGILLVQTSVASSEMTSMKGLGLIGAVNLMLFIGQMFFWARFIRLKDDEELGVANAALASLLYTFIFIFIGIGYASLFAALDS